jgi:hypothetical protein
MSLPRRRPRGWIHYLAGKRLAAARPVGSIGVRSNVVSEVLASSDTARLTVPRSRVGPLLREWRQLSAHEPVRSSAPSACVRSPHQLHRDRPRPTEHRDVAPTRRPPRRPAPRAQRTAPRSRLRARHARTDPSRPRTPSRHGRRPALGHRYREPRVQPLERGSRRVARAAGQRAPTRAAPQRRRAPDRQLRPAARDPASLAATPSHRHRGSGARRPLRGADRAPRWEASLTEHVGDDLAVPLRIRSRDSVLSFISTITTFARATDITVAELSIESFYPTDQATAEALRAFAATRPAQRRRAPHGRSPIGSAVKDGVVLSQ